MAFIVFALAGAGGLAVTSAQAFLTWLFRRRRFFAGRLRRQADGSVSSLQDASTTPPRFVSILKPVCGLDDELEVNLESFTRLRGVRHEIILSVADPADPALGVIERVRSRFPNAPFRLVIGGDPALELGNRKVARLVAAAAKARGDILMVSDSNVRVRPFDVAETVAAFDDERRLRLQSLYRHRRRRFRRAHRIAASAQLRRARQRARVIRRRAVRRRQIDGGHA
jgi:ceramide glucosyltransferase